MINILQLVWDVMYEDYLEMTSVNDFRFVDDFVEGEQARGLQAAEDFESFDCAEMYKFRRVESIDRSCSSRAYNMTLLEQLMYLSILWPWLGPD